MKLPSIAIDDAITELTCLNGSQYGPASPSPDLYYDLYHLVY
jgi:hypothetical protein